MTRGERNCNPGNIKYSPANKWQGQVGQDDDGFCVFDTPADGMRALAKLLFNYQAIDKLGTVRQIISRWSATDQAAYIVNVAKGMGVGADDRIDLKDDITLSDLVQSIIHQENGEVIYSQVEIDAAVAEA